MRIKAAFAALTLACMAVPALAMPPDNAALWREDLRFMAREMERLHKNLFHTVSRERFAAMVQALDARMPELERHEAIVELARIVAAVGDGHTNIYPTRDPKIGFLTLPVEFRFFGEDLYVRTAHASQSTLMGARVLRIGDQDVAAAYATVKAMIGRDNEQGARYWAPYLLAMPEVLHALRISRAADSVPLTVETSGGRQTVVVRPVGPAPIMSGDTATPYNRRDGWTDARDFAVRADPAWLRSTGNTFHWEHDGNLLYVQINTIGDKSRETLAQFARRLHDEIAATKPAKVAIDLRLNRGGDATLLPPLIRALVQSQAIDRKGRLFAIIGPGTFSAAQMFADAMEKYTNVTFVGEPSGSKGNAYGDSQRITLPHSGITVRASIYYWQEWHPMDTREAIIPEIAAPLTFEAYRDNIDPALEAIKRQVESTRP